MAESVPNAKTKRNGCCLFSLAFAALSIGGGVWYGWRTLKIIDEAYAVWQVAALVVEHMERSDGVWPKSWNDLRELDDMAAGHAPKWNSFENLVALVDIDWNADPKILAAAPDDGKSPPFKVVWLRNGATTHWGHYEPNRWILERLQRRAREGVKTKPPE